MSAALSLLKLLGTPFGALLKWMFADWRNIMVAVLAVGLANQAFRVAPGLRGEIAALTAQRNAKQGTIDNLRAEARQAAIRQQANLKRADAAHTAINRENVNALQSDVAGLRRRAELLADRLRAGQAAIYPRSADGAGVPGSVPARTGTAEAAGDQGLSGTAGAMSIYERLIASEQAYQLDRLIDAAEAAAGIDHSPDQVAGR